MNLELPGKDELLKQKLAQLIARSILDGFDRHFRIFSEITKGAKQRFEKADWQAERLNSRLRIEFYDKRVNEAIELLKTQFTLAEFDELLWRKVKTYYILLLQPHQQPELAETFFNSLFCRMFSKEYFHNHYIFVRSAVSKEYIDSEIPAYRAYYPGNIGFLASIKKVLTHYDLDLPFEDLNRDVRYIAKAICKKFKKNRKAELNFQYQVINVLFYRNKAAYIVGKAINGHNEYPFVVPILNNEKGAIYVDAFLLGEDSISRVFSFSYAYFMVSHPVPSAIVDFLGKLMPRREIEGLYSSIGFHKQGKNDFYRGFLHHLEYSDDNLILAPGIPGMVMSVFTLPSYPYVFKIIRDVFAPPKEITRKEVEKKYQLVKQHDRVGRMADTLEYSHVVLPLARFSEDLLQDLQETCASSISIEENMLIIQHVYIERRMKPLNIELEDAEKEGDAERLDELVMSYGFAIKELSAANIFPGDLLFKNFGVTRLNRVVFYDYDEIVYLTECNFRKIPAPRHPEDMMRSEPWYSVAPNDVFPEEFARFLLNNNKIKQSFMHYHADLLDADYWIRKQENIKKSIYEDVYPYAPKYRFNH